MAVRPIAVPATAPYDRQIVLGYGAFLELLSLAAKAFGADAIITLWPQGTPGVRLDDRPVSHIRFKAGSANKLPHFDQIIARRTNREPYDLTRIPTAVDLDAIAAVAATSNGVKAAYTDDPARVAALRDIVWRGWLREALLDPNSSANRQGASMWKEKADTAPAFLWLHGPDNTRQTQIEAGRAYARVNLEATARGLSIHPWSMSLEEYPEMADIYAEQQALLGGSQNAPIQMLVRIGYAPTTPPAPRRSLDAQIKA